MSVTLRTRIVLLWDSGSFLSRNHTLSSNVKYTRLSLDTNWHTYCIHHSNLVAPLRDVTLVIKTLMICWSCSKICLFLCGEAIGLCLLCWVLQTYILVCLVTRNLFLSGFINCNTNALQSLAQLHGKLVPLFFHGCFLMYAVFLFALVSLLEPSTRQCILIYYIMFIKEMKSTELLIVENFSLGTDWSNSDVLD